jgi:hypothetical protein
MEIFTKNYETMTSKKLNAELISIEKKKESISRKLGDLKGRQKEQKIQEYKKLDEDIIKIQSILQEIQKEINESSKEQSNYDYHHTIVPIKSTGFANTDVKEKVEEIIIDEVKDDVDIEINNDLDLEEADKRTSVLESTKEDILYAPIMQLTGTQILYMDEKDRIRENDRMLTAKEVIQEKIPKVSNDLAFQNQLIEKLQIINNNIAKFARILTS